MKINGTELSGSRSRLLEMWRQSINDLSPIQAPAQRELPVSQPSREENLRRKPIIVDDFMDVAMAPTHRKVLIPPSPTDPVGYWADAFVAA
jgi:hypothetical protein